MVHRRRGNKTALLLIDWINDFAFEGHEEARVDEALELRGLLQEREIVAPGLLVLAIDRGPAAAQALGRGRRRRHADEQEGRECRRDGREPAECLPPSC